MIDKLIAEKEKELKDLNAIQLKDMSFGDLVKALTQRQELLTQLQHLEAVKEISGE